ncbi:MAG: hypothetical protein HUK21_05085 [Fibrobacteraceae bacterium]|nr:hypothetical protein [Fibrobacteraceae bacterium]MCF0215827.1 hypothetical protein [Fibrobacteraceae bacterium]
MLRICFLTLSFFIFCSCSDNTGMDDDILDEYLLRQASFYIDKTDDEYLEQVARSFGISVSKVKKVQKHIISKKSRSKVEWDYDSAIIRKIKELKASKKESERNNFVYNILAPFLSTLSQNKNLLVKEDGQVRNQEVFDLFEKFFPGCGNSLVNFVFSVRGYFNGKYYNVNVLHDLNRVLMPYSLYVDFEIESCANIMQIQDTILAPMAYKGDSVAVLKTKRIIPGLLPSKVGYSTAATHFVVVIDDAVENQTEEYVRELKTDFIKYGDKIYNRYWHIIGLPQLDVLKASEIYTKLLEMDYASKSRNYIKISKEIETVIHEAKHQIDGIEHPELTLNLDAEFSAHVTSAIFSPSPYAALLSAIQRMDRFGITQGEPVLYNVSKQLWELAIKSANDSSYTRDCLKLDLIDIYNNYRTIREMQYFSGLDDFQNLVVSEISKYYQK